MNGQSISREISIGYVPFAISAQTPVLSGGTATGTVTLPAPALSDYLINLTNGGASFLKVPPSVTVLKGKATATFPITVYWVNVPGGYQTVFEIPGTIARSCLIFVQPDPLANVQLAASTINPGENTTRQSQYCRAERHCSRTGHVIQQ